MSGLTESLIFGRMIESLRLAEQASRELAVHPGAGSIYDTFRNNLRLVEGCCRQIAYFRDGDGRWLPIGLLMAKAHKMAGDWLRGVQLPNGRRRPLAPGERHPAFLKLAENLEAYRKIVDDLRHKATGRIGRILPEPMAGPARQRSVQVRTPGGIILPTGLAA